MSAPVRNSESIYLTRIPASPPGAKTLKISIPLPQSDLYQAIGGMQIESPFSYAKRRDPEYGNEYLYLQIPSAKVSALVDIRLSFHVTRHDHRVLLDTHQVNKQSPGIDPQAVRRFLHP